MNHQRECNRALRHRSLILGAISLAWLLLRSGANPRRLAYPCQRAALAGSLVWLADLAALLGILRLHSLASQRGVAVRVFVLLLLVVGLSGVGSRAPSALARGTLTLPSWTSPTAVSDVFVVSQAPIPQCSLDGGTLPSTPPCNVLTVALRDQGVDALLAEMSRRGVPFYETSGTPSGIVGSNEVVILKINNQWGHNGYNNGEGRLSTNNDVLKGLIWRVLNHPDGFSGEVVVAENTQGAGPGWEVSPANAQDPNQSIQDVVTTFQTLSYPVSLSNWDAIMWDTVSGGDVGGPGYPAGEYASGNSDDHYILLEDPGSSGTNELSYPKIQTTGGHRVSLRYGVWNGSDYESDRLCLINVPVLKAHGMAGATIAWKNLVGFITIDDSSGRYGSWEEMHDFFWGYTGSSEPAYGLLGREMALIRAPDLHLVDAIWVADNNYNGDAARQDVILASTDPFAADWYSSEYVLLPSWPGLSPHASAARAGTFRSATRANQNAAAALWPGGAYPYMDILDSYDGSTPSPDEANQLNIWIARELLFADGFETGDTTGGWS